MNNIVSTSLLALGIALAGLANTLHLIASFMETSRAVERQHVAYEACMKGPAPDELVRQYHCLTLDPSR